MAGFNFAQAKRQSRQALHGVLAVSAVYADAHTPPTPITARWHNKLVRQGGFEGGYDVNVIEGINKVVLNETELATALRPSPDTDPAAPGAPLILRRGGTLTFPDYEGLVLSLDSRAPSDGPLNVYWNVVEL